MRGGGEEAQGSLQRPFLWSAAQKEPCMGGRGGTELEVLLLFWLGIIYDIILMFKISYNVRMELKDSGKHSKTPFITPK